MSNYKLLLRTQIGAYAVIETFKTLKSALEQIDKTSKKEQLPLLFDKENVLHCAIQTPTTKLYFDCPEWLKWQAKNWMNIK